MYLKPSDKIFSEFLKKEQKYNKKVNNSPAWETFGGNILIATIC